MSTRRPAIRPAGKRRTLSHVEAEPGMDDYVRDSRRIERDLQTMTNNRVLENDIGQAPAQARDILRAKS